MNTIEHARQALGIRLRALRKERKLTCEQLADKVQGLTRSTLATIERGQRPCGTCLGSRLAKALDLKGDDYDTFMLACAATTVDGHVLLSIAGHMHHSQLAYWFMNHGFDTYKYNSP